VAEYSTQTASNPTISYLTSDNLGSPRITTDANGQVISRRDFMPFGEELGVNSPQTVARINIPQYNAGDGVRQKFTGYQKDVETQLDFAEARMYNNAHGRFTAVDPLLASGQSGDPRTFNRYAYVGNNPMNVTDSTGMSWDQDYNTITGGGWDHYEISRLGGSFDHVNRGTWITQTVRTTTTQESGQQRVARVIQEIRNRPIEIGDTTIGRTISLRDPYEAYRVDFSYSFGFGKDSFFDIQNEDTQQTESKYFYGPTFTLNLVNKRTGESLSGFDFQAMRGKMSNLKDSKCFLFL
jgi:RHS repeat-associated protein